MVKFDNSHLPKPVPPLPDNYNLRREAWLAAYGETSCQIVLSLCKYLNSGEAPVGSSQHFGAMNTIYIAYGRPFHRCAGVGKFERSDIPEHLYGMHDYLMEFRNKVYGHKDSNGIRVDDGYSINEVRAVVWENGELQIGCQELFARQPKIEEILKHTLEMHAYFGERMQSLIFQLLPRWRMKGIPGEFILSLDWRESYPFKRVPDEEAHIYKRG